MNALYAAVQACAARGWSVIPLIGGEDPARGKTPAAPWMRYRQQQPTADELHCWFATGAVSAYGIVCGRLSQLIVLDFDDADVAAEFNQQFPDLAETFTVRSGRRGTPHLYFRVDFPVTSRQVRGGDLKGEGGYVVGPGSRIAGFCWEVLHDLPVRPLTHETLEALLDFLKPNAQVAPEVSTEDSPLPASLDAAGAIRQYQRGVAHSGQRNTTLFRLACQLRDRGWNAASTLAVLADVHTHQPAQRGQPQERVEQRYREAQRTIASAYSRPPGRGHPPERADEPLDNSIREALLQQMGGAAFLRVYEGLSLLGLQAGATFTRRELAIHLQGIVGDYSIRQALALRVDDTLLFTPAPSPAPPSPADADPDGLPENKAKSCFVPQQKPTRSQIPAHRPAQVYRMPSRAELRERLQVQPTQGDPVALTELSSARRYRQALAREFIQRQPGQYPQGWLAKRLGVTTRSLYSYHRAEGIQAYACYHSLPLNWENYERLLPTPELARRMGLDVRGRFIEDEWGKRYPATLELARVLLTRQHILTLKIRTFSHYQVGSAAVQGFVAALTAGRSRDERAPLPSWRRPVTTPSAPPTVAITQRSSEPLVEHEAVPTSPLPAAPAAPIQRDYILAHKRQSYYPAPLPDADDERVAVWVYDTLAQIAGQAKFSLSNARCLVDLYGCEAVSTTLKRMLVLHQKGKISQPAGFMVVAIRVHWLTANRRAGTTGLTPRFRGEQRKVRRKGRQNKRNLRELDAMPSRDGIQATP